MSKVIRGLVIAYLKSNFWSKIEFITYCYNNSYNLQILHIMALAILKIKNKPWKGTHFKSVKAVQTKST